MTSAHIKDKRNSSLRKHYTSMLQLELNNANSYDDDLIIDQNFTCNSFT